MKITNLETDLEDGVLLINLLEQISSKCIHGYIKHPRVRAQKLENNEIALNFLKAEGIKIVGIGSAGMIGLFLSSSLFHKPLTSLLCLVC